MTDQALDGSTAVVTGGGRGIGLGIAQRLAAAGARVVNWDLEPGEHGVFTDAFVCDVTDEGQVADAAEASLSALGHVDILVNNAGINGPTKPAWDLTLEEWNRILTIDLTGVFLCSRSLVNHMRERGYGRIVNIASIAGKEGGTNAAAYASAKAGVIGFTKALAQDLAGSGVLVNAIAPAITETDLFAQLSDDFIADRRRRIPMARFCTVAEIAAMAVFAASPACSFTTGFTFDVSGGRATY